MISLTVLFYILVLLFVLIGAMRGFAKEIVVCASGVIALFIIEMVVPKVAGELSATKQFWVNFVVIIVCAFLGYQTPNFRKFIDSGRFERGAFRDILTGALMGGVNGYVYVSSIWYFLAQAGYPFPQITPPDLSTELGQTAERILSMAFPTLMQPPVILYAVVIAFLLLIGVFI
ncbi:MAG: CvpA family protein [Anaerolineaceae bacterium]